MTRVSILASSAEGDTASIIAQRLKERGLDICSAGQMLKADLSVAILESATPELFVDLGLLLGKGRSVLLVADDDKLPARLKDAPLIDESAPDLTEQVVAWVLRNTQLEVPSAETLRSLDTFASWLREDWDRLRALQPMAMERLVTLLLERNGIEVVQDRASEPFDFIMTARSPGIKLLIACKSSAGERSLGLGVVRELWSKSLFNKGNSCLLFSNANFTRAAKDWAVRSSPAIDLIGMEQLKVAIQAALTEESGSGVRPALQSFQRAKVFEKEHSAGAHQEWLSSLSRKELAHESGESSEAILKYEPVCFVSTSSAARKWRERISKVEGQDEHLVKTFLAVSTSEGHDWGRRLSRKVKESRCVVVVVDNVDRMPERQRLLHFLGHSCLESAVSASRRFTVLLDDHELDPRGLPVFLRASRILSGSDAEWEGNLRKLVGLISNSEFLKGED